MNRSHSNDSGRSLRRLGFFLSTLLVVGVGILGVTVPSANAERYPLDTSMFDPYVDEWSGHLDDESSLVEIPLDSDEYSLASDFYLELYSQTMDDMSTDEESLVQEWQQRFDGFVKRAKKTAQKKYKTATKGINRWYKKNKFRKNSKKIKQKKLARAKNRWLTQWFDAKEEELYGEFEEAWDFLWEIRDDAEEYIDSISDDISDILTSRLELTW